MDPLGLIRRDPFLQSLGIHRAPTIILPVGIPKDAFLQSLGVHRAPIVIWQRIFIQGMVQPPGAHLYHTLEQGSFHRYGTRSVPYPALGYGTEVRSIGMVQSMCAACLDPENTSRKELTMLLRCSMPYASSKDCFLAAGLL